MNVKMLFLTMVKALTEDMDEAGIKTSDKK